MNKKSPENTWNHEYYEILEFFFWEPQHLGKKKNPDNKYDSPQKVFDHLKKMEVTLNHLFNMFFTLLPDEERNELFSDLFKTKIQDEFIFNSNKTRAYIDSIGSVTQPDLLFSGKENFACIEMKIEAKSSLEQLMKYLLLSILADEHGETKRKTHLLFMAKYELPDLFIENVSTMEEARSALIQMTLPNKSKNGNIDLTQYHNQILDTAKRANLCFYTYKDFYNLLQEKMLKDNHPVIIKLMEGICNELEIRNMIQI